MFAALRARERNAHARSHHLAFQHAIAGSDSAFGSMRLLAELKEHHGCVNHVSFSSSGVDQEPLLGELGSSLVDVCWRKPCADADQLALFVVSSIGLTVLPRKQLACLGKGF